MTIEEFLGKPFTAGGENVYRLYRHGEKYKLLCLAENRVYQQEFSEKQVLHDIGPEGCWRLV